MGSELVRVYDALPMMLWCKYFIEAKGYMVKHNIFYQDKKSAILLANNGQMSSYNRTKHINVRCFLV